MSEKLAKTAKIVGAALLVYMAIAFFVPKLLGVGGTAQWILFGGLALIGVIAAFAYLFTEKRADDAAKKEAAEPGSSKSDDQLVQLLNEAEERLRSSNLGKNARFSSLPALFVLGSRGATKTTTLMQSGLAPELLAGQVYQEGNIIAPTRFVNAWFARQWVFLEAGASALADASQWTKLIQRMRPGQLQGARKGAQSPRAALVCFDCEELIRARSPEGVAALAREMREKLAAISQTLGISLPVYVLFTKLDRVPYFTDYFQTLTNEESVQVLGATLSARVNKGAYDEEQTAQLNAALDRIYFSLAEHRTTFLGREGDVQRLPGAYEYPREFRKIRNLLAAFLLDVCRPSQLTAAPFLRGFYFSGVRPIMVRDVAPTPVVAKRGMGPDTGATGVFRLGPDPAAGLQPESSAVRKVPQWLFLKQLFGQVILADETALGRSAVTVTTSRLKLALLACAAALGLFLSIAWIVSFSQNSDLQATTREAAAAIKLDTSAAPPIPALDDLTKLDALRQSLETIGRYNREGAPLSYRWGLYSGQEIYPKARKVYFRRFFQLLFSSTQTGLVVNLLSLPSTPGPADSYQYPYDSLKSYLITTSNHDKSTKLYLSPVLYSRWEAGKNVDAARAQLVRKQFDFYADELRFDNPFTADNDASAISRARRYLQQFAGTQRVYLFMLAEVNKNNPSLIFNQKFPGSAQTVINTREVAGAYTKAGWAAMQDAIKHADKYFAGEQWVLGDQSAAMGDRAKLEMDLQTLYVNDFVEQWRDYLKKTTVVRYDSIQDAAKKLQTTSSAQSPLLAMFCMAAQNVGADPEVAKSFKPLLGVVQSSCGDQYVGPPNQDYMKSLVALQISLGQITSSDPNDPNVAQAANNATAAKVVTAQMAQNFGVDPMAGTVQSLIEAPITYIEPLVKGLGAAALNKGGKSLCNDLRALMNKYPFNPASTTEATVADVNGIYKPMDGSLWKFYDQNLAKLLPKQGGIYVPAPNSNPMLLPGFVNFFNRMAAFSGALYGSGDLRFTYALKPVRTEGIQGLTVTIDGQTMTYNGGNNAAAKQFSWPGDSSGVKATAKIGGVDITWQTFSGLWGVFKFFAKSVKPVSPGAVSNLEWLWQTGDQVNRLPNGNPISFRLDLDMGASPPVFSKGYLSAMSCVADVAK